MSTLHNVTLHTKSNVYFDGKCISHTVQLTDGSQKTVGVIFPSTLTFTTGAPETMEITGGKCRVKLADADAWQLYEAGQQFAVPGNSAFEIDTLELLDYVCHFG